MDSVTSRNSKNLQSSHLSDQATAATGLDGATPRLHLEARRAETRRERANTVAWRCLFGGAFCRRQRSLGPIIGRNRLLTTSIHRAPSILVRHFKAKSPYCAPSLLHTASAGYPGRHYESLQLSQAHRVGFANCVQKQQFCFSPRDSLACFFFLHRWWPLSPGCTALWWSWLLLRTRPGRPSPRGRHSCRRLSKRQIFRPPTR